MTRLGWLLGILGVPILLYFFITTWDPTRYKLYGNEETLPFGLALIIGLYLIALDLAYAYRKGKKKIELRERQLRKLLYDKMEDEESKLLREELENDITGKLDYEKFEREREQQKWRERHERRHR